MKINKWTLGLAAVGLVSLSSVTQAEEAATPLLTALSSTTISGYVDVGAHWNPGNGEAIIPLSGIGSSKADGFNINSVLISLEKPLEEGEWSAGYRADLQFGPDASSIIGGDNDHIRQAYVALRAPVGNGLDLKLGRWDTIIGYESSDGYKNPNYTRSFGWGIEPTEHTGLLATYQALEFLSVNVGVANTLNTGALNGRNSRGSSILDPNDSHKTYMASVAFTAPEDMGALAGSALYAGVIDGFGGTEDQTSWYIGATITTPVEGLRLGAAFDYVQDPASGTLVPFGADDIWTTALYASFKATEKLGLNLRGEYFDFDGADGWAATATVDYSLWDNVLSRVEVRYDDGDQVIGAGEAFLVAANVIYKF